MARGLVRRYEHLGLCVLGGVPTGRRLLLLIDTVMRFERTSLLRRFDGTGRTRNGMGLTLVWRCTYNFLLLFRAVRLLCLGHDYMGMARMDVMGVSAYFIYFEKR